MSSPERDLGSDEVMRLLTREGSGISALRELVTDLRADMNAEFDASATRDADLDRKLALILAKLS